MRSFMLLKYIWASTLIAVNQLCDDTNRSSSKYCTLDKILNKQKNKKRELKVLKIFQVHDRSCISR